MESKPHVVVLITAGNCSHCVDFAPQVDALEKSITSYGLQFVRVPVTTMNQKSVDTTRYPIGLNKYKKWFPALVMFKGNDWSEAMRNTTKEYPLMGKIFNGHWDDSKGAQLLQPAKYAMTKEDIMSWVAEASKELSKRTISAPAQGGSLIKPMIEGSIFASAKTGDNSKKTGQKSVCSMRIVPKQRG